MSMIDNLAIEQMKFDGYIGLVLVIVAFLIHFFRVKQSRKKVQKPQMPPATPVPVKTPPAPLSAKKKPMSSLGNLSDNFLAPLEVDSAYRQKKKKTSRIQSVIKKAGSKRNLIIISEIMNRPY